MKNLVEPIKDKKLVEEVEKYLTKQSLRNQLIWVFGCNTGLRISDIFGLNVEDVDGKSFIEIREKKTGKGNISLEKVACQLYNEGFVFKDTQAKIYKSQLEHILKNPFYYGMVQFKKELYEGKHEPIITEELFDITQKTFRKDNKPKYTQAYDFLFTGMLKCVHCDCVISGEIKKGKYIYYSCTGGKGECEQEHIYIKEEKLEKQIIEAISKIKITDEHKTWITNALADSFNDEQRYTKERLNSLNSQKDRLRERIDKLYLDKLDGTISEDFWLDKHNKWTNELKTIQENITAFENTNINFIEECAKFLKICNEIDDLYNYADKNEKKDFNNFQF